MATASANAVRSRRRALLALVLLVPILAAAPAWAQTLPDLEEGLQSALAEIASAVVALSQGDATTASADLGEASALLEELATLATDPTVKAEMGRLANRVRAKIRTVGKRVHRARTAVDSPTKRLIQQLKALKTAYTKGLSAASTVRTLVFTEEGSKAAGFHKPGDLVTFRARAADGASCTEVPTVTVQHQGFPNVVDLNTVAAWPDGTITMTMGEDQGCAFVTVTACGRSSTLLLYNYGPKLAHGFPTNLPLGTYALSIRVTGAVDMPETPMGTIDNVNLQDFANELTSFLDQMAGQLDEVPGCSGRINYTRFDGQAFTAKFTLSCSYAGQSASVTVIFKIEKV